MTSARQAAAQALLQVERQGGYSNIVFGNLVRKYHLAGQDSALAAALFYGALERIFTLDYVISHYTGKPMAKLTPEVAQILRITFYQLLYLDGIPDRAAVSEGVSLTRRMGCGSASGFVNGVCRSFLRDGKQIPPASGDQALEVKWSCPIWLISLLRDSYGMEEAEKILAGFLGRKTLYARLNPLKATREQLQRSLESQGVGCRWDNEMDGCLALEHTGDLENLTAFREGWFHIQDKACQQAVEALSPRPGERVLDVCSAPGSKAFTMAQLMENRGEVIACDIYPHKLELIRQGARRLGISIVRAEQRDGTQSQEDLGLFDRVLCDVPCSGLGILGKKPEIRLKQPEELRELPRLQGKILSTAARRVKPGGKLLYSTCTLNPSENERVVEQFLSEEKEFSCAGGFGVTLLPFEGDRDGFFYALLERRA